MSDEILTGEGVALQIDAAAVITRAGAWLIDAAVTGAAALALVFGFAMLDIASNFDEALAMAFFTLLLVLLFLVAPMTVEALSHGRSLGKLALGLQVIRDDGGPIRLRHAAMRALVGVFELWLLAGGPAFVTSMFNDRGKRLGDYLAGTYVARMRGVHAFRVPLYLPPSLANWVKSADIRPLPDGLALRARQFLSRATQFPGPIRYRFGLRLAAQVELFVAPAPPPGTYPEPYLSAVLWEVRRREEAQLQRTLPRVNTQLAGIEVLPFGIPDPER